MLYGACYHWAYDTEPFRGHTCGQEADALAGFERYSAR
jgi:hypothetical protein